MDRRSLTIQWFWNGVSLLLLLWSPSAWSLGLLDIYELAVHHNLQYQAARFAHAVGQEEEALGKAGLLPTLQYGYNANTHQSKVIQAGSRQKSIRRDYDSYASTLSLRQPLLDYAAYARYRQGSARKRLADQRFRDQSQLLMVKVYRAYSSVLLAQEIVTLLQAQARAYQEQCVLNRRLLAAGEGTRTSLLETEARYKLTEAKLIKEQDNLDDKLTQLENFIGQPLQIDQLSRLDLQQQPENPAHLQSWQQWHDLAIQHNARLAAQREKVSANAYEIERNRAGHLPNLKLVATLRNTRSEAERNYDQKYDTHSVGIQLSVPLYAGGSVSAATRKAGAHYQQSRAELDDQTQQILVNLKRQFNLFDSSAARIRAYQLAVDAAREAVRATRMSVVGGERVNLDVLLAEQQLYTAQYDLAEAKYHGLQSWLELRYNAGILQESDMLQLTAYFPER